LLGPRRRATILAPPPHLPTAAATAGGRMSRAAHVRGAWMRGEGASVPEAGRLAAPPVARAAVADSQPRPIALPCGGGWQPLVACGAQAEVGERPYVACGARAGRRRRVGVGRRAGCGPAGCPAPPHAAAAAPRHRRAGGRKLRVVCNRRVGRKRGAGSGPAGLPAPPRAGGTRHRLDSSR
jgi:hypothetical protein